MNSLLNLTGVCAELARLADAQTASFLKRFFKTGPGDYGAGDLFRGIRVPTLRRLARAYQNLTLAEIQELLYCLS